MSHPSDLRGTGGQPFPNPDLSQPSNANLHRNSGTFDDAEDNRDRAHLPAPATNAPMETATSQNEMMQMMEMMRALTQRVNESRLPHAPPIQVKDPGTFHGQRNKLNAFLKKCEINFTVQPSRFTSDSLKINYVISYLRDSPLLAIRPHLSRAEKPDFLEDYPKFVEYLKTYYGDPDEEERALRRLNSLRQTSSASAYFAEFKRCVAILGWKEQGPLIDKAKQGLNATMKDELARVRTKFRSVEELINFVIPLDKRMYERELERKREEMEGPTQTSTKPEVSNPFASVTQTNSISPFRPTNRSNQPRGPIDNNERARRIAENLCLYCGDSSHQIRDCAARNRRNQVLNQAQFKIEGPSPTESRNN